MSCFAGGFSRGKTSQAYIQRSTNASIEYDTLSTVDLDNALLHATTGNGLTMMSNRLSWFYDLRGKFPLQYTNQTSEQDLQSVPLLQYPRLNIHSRPFYDGRHGLLQLTSRIVSRSLITADRC